MSGSHLKMWISQMVSPLAATATIIESLLTRGATWFVLCAPVATMRLPAPPRTLTFFSSRLTTVCAFHSSSSCNFSMYSTHSSTCLSMVAPLRAGVMNLPREMTM